MHSSITRIFNSMLTFYTRNHFLNGFNYHKIYIFNKNKLYKEFLKTDKKEH